MAYVRSDGKVRVRAFSRPMPKYDFEPLFAEEPDPVALRRQLADLITRAIRLASSEDLGLEEGEAVAPEWRIDWGQLIASGTDKATVEELLEDVPTQRIEKILLRAFYNSVLEIIDLSDGAIDDLMAVHSLNGVVTDVNPQIDNIQLLFGEGDEMPMPPDLPDRLWDADDDDTGDARDAGDDERDE